MVINTCYYLCSYVDEGRNPQLFTKDQLERTLEDHKTVQKKVEAYKVRSPIATHNHIQICGLFLSL